MQSYSPAGDNSSASTSMGGAAGSILYGSLVALTGVYDYATASTLTFPLSARVNAQAGGGCPSPQQRLRRSLARLPLPRAAAAGGVPPSPSPTSTPIYSGGGIRADLALLIYADPTSPVDGALQVATASADAGATLQAALGNPALLDLTGPFSAFLAAMAVASGVSAEVLSTRMQLGVGRAALPTPRDPSSAAAQAAAQGGAGSSLVLSPSNPYPILAIVFGVLLVLCFGGGALLWRWRRAAAAERKKKLLQQPALPPQQQPRLPADASVLVTAEGTAAASPTQRMANPLFTLPASSSVQLGASQRELAHPTGPPTAPSAPATSRRVFPKELPTFEPGAWGERGGQGMAFLSPLQQLASQDLSDFEDGQVGRGPSPFTAGFRYPASQAYHQQQQLILQQQQQLLQQQQQQQLSQQQQQQQQPMFMRGMHQFQASPTFSARGGLQPQQPLTAVQRLALLRRERALRESDQ